MDCNIGVRGEGYEYIFSRGKGLTSIRFDGVQLLDDTVRPSFWRAPTNNDDGCAEPFEFAFWKTAGLYARCDNLTVEAGTETVTVHAVYTLPDGRTLPIDFTVDGTGRCEVAMTWRRKSGIAGVRPVAAAAAGADRRFLSGPWPP